MAIDGRGHAAPQGTRGLVPQELLAVLELFATFDMTADFLPIARNGSLQMPQLTAEQLTVGREELFASGLNGAPRVRMLVYTPPKLAAAPRPAYLHIHGGGYVLGSPEMNDSENRALALDHDCVVISVDYRLAPEARWPSSLEDTYAALLWLYHNAEVLGIDTARIAIGGESAGGGHAAALAIHARHRGEVPISFMLLDSPMLDDRTGSTSVPHPYCGEFVWTPKSNRFGWEALLGMEPGGEHVPEFAAPARVRDLSGLPPTFLSVGSIDLFLEENLEFARRLIRAGVKTELHVIAGGFHGLGAAGPIVPQIEALWDLRRTALARAFANGPEAA